MMNSRTLHLPDGDQVYAVSGLSNSADHWNRRAA